MNILVQFQGVIMMQPKLKTTTPSIGKYNYGWAQINGKDKMPIAKKPLGVIKKQGAIKRIFKAIKLWFGTKHNLSMCWYYAAR